MVTLIALPLAHTSLDRSPSAPPSDPLGMTPPPPHPQMTPDTLMMPDDAIQHPPSLLAALVEEAAAADSQISPDVRVPLNSADTASLSSTKAASPNPACPPFTPPHGPASPTRQPHHHPWTPSPSSARATSQAMLAGLRTLHLTRDKTTLVTPSFMQVRAHEGTSSDRMHGGNALPSPSSSARLGMQMIGCGPLGPEGQPGCRGLRVWSVECGVWISDLPRGPSGQTSHYLHFPAV